MPLHAFDDDPDNEDKQYHESSDDDFNPDFAPAEDPSSSEAEDQALSKPTRRNPKTNSKAKRKALVDEGRDEGLDSGDELTIQAAQKARAKRRKGNNSDDSDDDLILSADEGGEGGLIKTRAQRRVEKKERRPLARIDGATADVDALWAQMMAVPLKPSQPVRSHDEDVLHGQVANQTSAAMPLEEEEQVSIRKVYNFAGQDTTDEKQIPLSHLDKYLRDGWKAARDPEKPSNPEAETSTGSNKVAESQIRRPLRRPTRFDPNPTGFVRALAPELQLSWPRKTIAALLNGQTPMLPSNLSAKAQKARKLNVVDKSRLDWTGFVDKEGIAEELDTHGKTKEAYLGRMDFLAGVEAKREEERRNFKIKTAAAPTPM